jgi:Holliday junction resolvase RusA-like endonuclease
MKKTSTSKSDFASHVRKFLGASAITVFLAVEPTPASRPRVSKWGTYYGKNYEKFRRDVREVLADAGSNTKISGPIYAVLEFVVTPPKTTKRDFPRGDVDNFAKGPLDSLTSNGNFWDDDDQIIGLAVTKRFALPDETPGIHITYIKAEVKNEPN